MTGEVEIQKLKAVTTAHYSKSHVKSVCVKTQRANKQKKDHKTKSLPILLKSK